MPTSSGAGLSMVSQINSLSGFCYRQRMACGNYVITKPTLIPIQYLSDSDWPQLRGLAILALRGALKFFAVLNVLGEDFVVFWREHDELFNRFLEEFKNSKSFPSGPFYFRLVLPDSLF